MFFFINFLYSIFREEIDKLESTIEMDMKDISTLRSKYAEISKVAAKVDS